ncbi:MAG: hypothetical protein RMN52_03845 [Anaerolineae bacterium]|nr:hypothetical protein [Candidatus Roseilinea sp.]MDW8449114.1 hypothetical protein [Anaerolineae bacterium]
MNIGQELFGAWTTGAAVEKDLAASAPAIGAIWRRAVPPDARTARSALQAQDEALQRDHENIEKAIQRLNDFIEAWTPGQPARAKSLKDAPQPPEDALAAALDRIRAPQAKDLLDPLQAAREEFDAFVRRVGELVSHYAVIETSSNGTLIARTLVSWTGDFKSLLRSDATPDQIRLHERNVRAALARRAALIRLMGVISTSAAKIALRLATPGAQLLVLPALWQFVRDVIEELRRAEARGVS